MWVVDELLGRRSSLRVDPSLTLRMRKAAKMLRWRSDDSRSLVLLSF
jgi:hypothetical protein